MSFSTTTHLASPRATSYIPTLSVRLFRDPSNRSPIMDWYFNADPKLPNKKFKPGPDLPGKESPSELPGKKSFWDSLFGGQPKTEVQTVAENLKANPPPKVNPPVSFEDSFLEFLRSSNLVKTITSSFEVTFSSAKAIFCVFGLIAFVFFTSNYFLIPLFIYCVHITRLVLKYNVNPWVYRGIVIVFFLISAVFIWSYIFFNPVIVDTAFSYIRDFYLSKLPTDDPFYRDYFRRLVNSEKTYSSLAELVCDKFTLETAVGRLVADPDGIVLWTGDEQLDWYISFNQFCGLFVPALIGTFLFLYPLADRRNLVKHGGGRNTILVCLVCHPFLVWWVESTLYSLPMGVSVRGIPETSWNPFLLQLAFLSLLFLLIIGARFLSQEDLIYWILIPGLFLSLSATAVDFNVIPLKYYPPTMSECWSKAYDWYDLAYLADGVAFTDRHRTVYAPLVFLLSMFSVLAVVTVCVNSFFCVKDATLEPWPVESTEISLSFSRGFNMVLFLIGLFIFLALAFDLDNIWVQPGQWCPHSDPKQMSLVHFGAVFGLCADDLTFFPPEAHEARIQLLKAVGQWSSDSLTLYTMENWRLVTGNQLMAWIAILGFFLAFFEKYACGYIAKKFSPIPRFYSLFIYLAYFLMVYTFCVIIGGTIFYTIKEIISLL